MSQSVILIEVVVTPPVGEPTTLRFCDRSVRPFPPSDPDRANLTWDDRLIEPPTIRRGLWADLGALDPDVGMGVATLSNGDRGLAAYEAWTWGEITVRRWIEGTPFAASRLLMSGVCANPPDFSYSSGVASRVRLGFYDHRVELEAALQTNLYSGANGTGGVLYEGAVDGLKGRPKPLAYGLLLDAHLPAPQVNASVMAFQLHDGAIQGSIQVFDRGADAGLIDEGDKTGATFDSHSFGGAARRVSDISRALIKANWNPVGTTSFGCRGDVLGGGYVQTAGPILERLLRRAGVPAARIGAITAKTTSTAPVGVYVGDQSSARDVIAWVARSALVSLMPDRQGVWRAYPIAPPAAVAITRLAEDQVVEIDGDKGAPEPLAQARVGWGRIWTTFAGDSLASELRASASAERLAAEYRYAQVEDTALKGRLKGSWRSVEITTALRNEADADAVARSLLALFGLRSDGKPRRAWRVTVELTDEILSLELGDTITLDYPPLGLGGNYLLLAEEPLRPSRDLTILTLWG